MSVRKREWTTRKGEQREAWIVDYTANGSRHIETFERKKDADAYEAKVTVDVGKGIHIAPSRSVTVAEAGDRWIKACEADELERATINNYKQHLRLHINPHVGHYKLSTLTVPLMRKFRDDLRDNGRSPTRVRVVMASFGALLADAMERGLVATNVVRGMKKERSFHNSAFDPQTPVLLEAAFDEAWLTLKSVGNKTVKPDELARAVLRLAMEGERDPILLHDGALEGLLPATAWREAS
jgi:Phage integrase, N-terminal SAM-like domain